MIVSIYLNILLRKNTGHFVSTFCLNDILDNNYTKNKFQNKSLYIKEKKRVLIYQRKKKGPYLSKKNVQH